MIKENVALATMTYYKIGGPARYFAEPQSLDDLKNITEWLNINSVKFIILGAGSNVLISDEGFNGLVIRTNKLNSTLTHTNTNLCAGSSVLVIHLLRHCMQHGLMGFDFLVGIPGNVGGIVAMNAGTRTGCVADAIQEVSTYNLKTQKLNRYNRDQISYSYRAQHFMSPYEIVYQAVFNSKQGDALTVQNQTQALLAERKKNQPIDKPSCGSVFKNPDPENKIFAWQLIEQAGLKGFKIGNAEVSNLHANFIINLGGAKSTDVAAIIAEIKQRVKQKFNVVLEEEVKMIGADSGHCW